MPTLQRKEGGRQGKQVLTNKTNTHAHTSTHTNTHTNTNTHTHTPKHPIPDSRERGRGWVGVLDDDNPRVVGGLGLGGGRGAVERECGKALGVLWGVGVAQKGGARCVVAVEGSKVVVGTDTGKELVLTF